MLITSSLDAVIAEQQPDRKAVHANERFIRSGIQIKDVFRKLAK